MEYLCSRKVTGLKQAVGSRSFANLNMLNITQLKQQLKVTEATNPQALFCRRVFCEKNILLKFINVLTWCIFLNKLICLCKAERWLEAVKQFWSQCMTKTGNSNQKLLVFTIKMNLRLIKSNIFRNSSLFLVHFLFVSLQNTQIMPPKLPSPSAAHYLKVNTRNKWGFLLQTPYQTAFH